jgi:NADH:ubiquinone oxidoreductase subunit C
MPMVDGKVHVMQWCYISLGVFKSAFAFKVFAKDDDFPVFPTLVDVWPVANWFEREAFDLFG